MPEYNENIAEHFYHQYELLKELSKELDVFLIAEKGKGDEVHIQKFRFLPLRFMESFLMILWARIKGYRNFYTHYCYIGGINAGIISRLFGGKSHYWHCEMIWEFKQKIFSKIGFRLALKLSHFLVTGSDKLKKEYAKHYGLKLKNIKVMPNWINLKRFNISSISTKRSDQASSKTILFVHWLAKRKGAHLLVPISKLVDAKFIVIGDGPLKNKLEKSVQVLGKIPNKDLMKYYAKADIFIMPSLQEGFPRVLLEAMAMGVPYVASDVGAVREISPKIAQKFLVERGDVEDFAKKINLLLSDKKIYEKFRKEELEKVKEYSLDKIVNKFINLFL